MNCLPPAGWLSNDVPPVGCSAVVWLERGAQDRPSIRSARHGSTSTLKGDRHDRDHRDRSAQGVRTRRARSMTRTANSRSSSVRAGTRQLDQLLGWASPFAERTWAIESAGGLGYLLAQQLVAAGERVVDVPATLSSRVRLLGSGRSNKNDANDARAVAVAALRAPSLAAVRVEDHVTVLRLLAKAHLDLGRRAAVPVAGCMRSVTSWSRAGSAKKSLFTGRIAARHDRTDQRRATAAARARARAPRRDPRSSTHRLKRSKHASRAR